MRAAGGIPVTEDQRAFRLMRIERHFTKGKTDAYEGIAFRQATSEIRNPDGSVVFRQENIEVPPGRRGSQVARRAGAENISARAWPPS